LPSTLLRGCLKGMQSAARTTHSQSVSELERRCIHYTFFSYFLLFTRTGCVLRVPQVHVIIQEIFLNGAVHKDGRLFPGDQVVAVRRCSVPRLCRDFIRRLCTNL